MKILFHKTTYTLLCGKQILKISLRISTQKTIPMIILLYSVQQDAIITDLDLRSTRHGENADYVDPEQREDEIDNADLRSARLQQDTS